MTYTTKSPSLRPVLSAWLGMIGNMAMGRWAVARRTRTATPRLKRSCCRPFHTRCNPAAFSDSVATDPTRWRLTPDGLTPFFQEYELAGCAFGQPEVTSHGLTYETSSNPTWTFGPKAPATNQTRSRQDGREEDGWRGPHSGGRFSLRQPRPHRASLRLTLAMRSPRSLMAASTEVSIRITTMAPDP
jgi:hypothetical protein